MQHTQIKRRRCDSGQGPCSAINTFTPRLTDFSDHTVTAQELSEQPRPRCACAHAHAPESIGEWPHSSTHHAGQLQLTRLVCNGPMARKRHNTSMRRNCRGADPDQVQLALLEQRKQLSTAPLSLLVADRALTKTTHSSATDVHGSRFEVLDGAWPLTDIDITAGSCSSNKDARTGTSQHADTSLDKDSQLIITTAAWRREQKQQMAWSSMGWQQRARLWALSMAMTATSL